MDLTQKEIRKLETMRRRGWMIYLLYKKRPNPMDFGMLIRVLDARSIPLTFKRLAEELDFLRGAGLIRVFPLGSDTSLTDVEQAKLLQRYADSEGELNDSFCACIRTKGINFQEGHFEETGISRVN